MITHMFRPGETVEAVLKKINRHDVSKDELVELLAEYRRINGDAVPRAGTQMKIPVLTRHRQEVMG